MILFIVASCNKQQEIDIIEPQSEEEALEEIREDQQAVVLSVSVSGEENAYTFNVQLKSPDTGCRQYADWWEVVDEEEELAYRRILTHSHVSEQPFARSGGPVRITKDQEVFVRGHMNNLGYGPLVMSGSVSQGFKRDTADVSVDLERTDPQPEKCEF